MAELKKKEFKKLVSAARQLISEAAAIGCTGMVMPYKSPCRQQFESWVSSDPYREDIERFPDDPSYAWPGCYKSLKVMLAWDAWCEAWERMRQ